MNPLQKKLREIQEKYGQDAFLDSEMLARELKMHCTITKKNMEPVIWCARREVYFKIYADQDPLHMWYFRHLLQKQMQEEGLTDAEEALDAWMGLANYHKKDPAFHQPPAGSEALCEALWTACKGFEAGMEAEAMAKLMALAEESPLAHYYAGRCLLRGKQRDEQGAAVQFALGAQAGNRDAVYEYGNCLRGGWGMPPDEAAAVQQYLEAARLLHPQALFLVGVLYDLGGAGVEKNPIRCLYYLSWAARQGHREARAWLAVHYKAEADSGQVLNAHPFFTEETVDMAAAYCQVAEILENGSCFVQNKELAAQNYKKAAVRGSQAAQRALAERFAQAAPLGEEPASNLGHWKARAELQTAATGGNAEAQYRMGTNYLRGEPGFEKNPTMALSWFRRGAAGGSAACQRMLPVCQYLIGMTFVGGGEAGKAVKGLPFWKRALENAELLDKNMRCDCHYQIAAACFAAGEHEEGEAQMAYPLEQNYLKAYLFMAKAWQAGSAGPASWDKAFGYYLAADRISPAQARPVLEDAYAAAREKGLGLLSPETVQAVEAQLAQPV